MYKGRVTHRISGAPLENVSVSDGKNITMTDSNGCFELEGWERAHLIYLNLLTDVDGDWYIKIDGREGDYDFSVTPSKTTPNFCFMHTSDTEIENIPFIEWLPFFRNNVAEHKPAFFINTGDLCRDFGMKRHKLIMNRETLGCPVRYAIGNHDFTGKDYGEQSYEDIFGPVWYSFDCGNVHFIVTSIGKGEKPSGFEPQDQWIWLKNDLQNISGDKKIIVFNHGQCPNDETAFRIKLGDIDIDLREHGIIAWVYGHIHFNSANEYNGVLNLCTACADTGGIDSSAAGIRKTSLNNGELTSEIIYYTNEVESADDFVWSVKLGTNGDFSTPILYNGDFIAATSDDSYPKNCGISRVDGKNGDVKWRFDTCNGVRNDMALSEGVVYAQDSEGYLYALDVDSGELLWKAKSSLRRPMYTKMNVLVIDDIVIGGVPFKLSAYDKKTGELLWIFETEKGCESTPARLVYDEKTRCLVLSRHWRDLMVVDLDTREIKWSYSEDMVRFRNETPIVKDGKIYCAGLRKLHIFDEENGELLVCGDSPCCMDVCGSPVYDGEVLYYPTATLGVIAVERDTLKEIRRYKTSTAGVITPPYRYGNIQTVESTPIIKGDTLIFSSSDGCVYFYNKYTAELERKIRFGAPLLTTPIFEEGTVTALDFFGRLSKIKL